MRTGVASRQEAQGSLVRQIRSQRLHPAGAEDLEQGIEACEGFRTSLDEGLAQARRSAQRVAWTKASLGMEPFGMKKRQPSQHPRVQAIALGVLAVVGAQI
jgi:hypothetical protein